MMMMTMIVMMISVLGKLDNYLYIKIWIKGKYNFYMFAKFYRTSVNIINNNIIISDRLLFFLFIKKFFI